MFLAEVLSAIGALPALFSDLAALFNAVVSLFHSDQGQEIAQAARKAVSDAEATYQPLVTPTAGVGMPQSQANELKREFAVQSLTGLQSVTVPEHQARVAVEMAVAEKKQTNSAAKPSA